jgi:hypothetical protein
MLAKSLVPALVGTALSGTPAAAGSLPDAPATPPSSAGQELAGQRRHAAELAKRPRARGRHH